MFPYANDVHGSIVIQRVHAAAAVLYVHLSSWTAVEVPDGAVPGRVAPRCPRGGALG